MLMPKKLSSEICKSMLKILTQVVKILFNLGLEPFLKRTKILLYGIYTHFRIDKN